MISRALASGEVQHFESNFDGRAFAFAARPLPTEGYANIYGLDITERKAAANALRKSEARIRALFNATSDSAILMDTEGVILAINEHGAKRRGLNPEDMLGHLIYDHLPQDAAETRRRQTSEALRTGNPNTFEEQRGGFFYSITIYPILDADGTARQLASFSRDITAQKQSEQALRESEATFRAMVETVPLAIYLSTGVEQVSEYVNPTFVTLFGYTLEDVPTAAHWWPLAYPDAEYRSKVVGEWTRRVTRAIETQTAIDPMEAVCTCKDGSQKTISWGYIALGSRNYAYGLDLTERKRAEEALRRQVLALTQPLDSPASIRFTDLFNLEDIQRIQDTFAESMNVASIITTPDGVPLTNPSNFCRLCRDIIRKTEKGLANCYASDAVLGRLNLDGPTIKPCLSGGLWDAGASISVGGQHIANWLIGQVKNQAQDEDAMLRYADEIGADAEEFRAALAEVPVMSSEQFGRVAKALFLMSSELSLRAYQNAQQARFIHARQQAEEEVRRNNARLQGLVRVLQHKTESVQELLDNSLSEALALSGSRFGYIYHYSEERREFVLNTWSGEVMAECTVKAAPQVYQLAKTGIWGEAVRQRKPIVVNDFQAANPLKRGYPEGHVQLSNFMTVPVFQGGRIVAVAGVGNKNGDYQDADVLQLSLLMDACWQVAARLEAEHSVRRERVFADALLNSVPGLVYLYDDQGRLVRWNKSHETITGYSSGELSQMHLLDWYQGDPDAIERITKAIERVSQDGAGVEEALLQTKDGRRIPFYFSAVRLEIEGRGYFTGIGIDITERRQSEEEIRRSLHEKEILLKEIHHRVKNNLQIISSLLFLQAEYVIEPLDRTMFEESQKRISAMALVHEELYGSNDLSSVSMGDYVPRLVERVVASSDVSVQVEFDVEDMRLPVTRSIPCGLVLNEMVMNAVKHAFRNGRQGRLRVSLARRGGQVELAVEDNGPGLPPDFDLESPATLGLTLISSLARQLAGSVTAQSLEAGARFVLVFPVEEL
ncbi:MAG: hypothetical protein A2051_02670 [Desulfovibrionales bacterium GWA2_65_9]|nr:MAG: hypothetical protein A2051_02670 [Desulfovibrionales bacterium GWA2_65_9]